MPICAWIKKIKENKHAHLVALELSNNCIILVYLANLWSFFKLMSSIKDARIPTLRNRNLKIWLSPQNFNQASDWTEISGKSTGMDIDEFTDTEGPVS